MQITIHVHRVEVTCPSVTQEDLQALENRIMSVISDRIAAVSTSFDAALVRVTEDVDALKAELAALQQNAVSQADLDAIDALQSKIDALDPTKPAVLPEPEVPPTV